MQLTSGGFERASRAASLMRRLQLIPVLCGPMRLTRVFAVLVLATPLLGCDEYETAYQDVPTAEADGAFSRGWLPPLLPADADTIVERHDLDTNEVWGCFDAPSGAATIREKLQAARASRVSGPVGPRPTRLFITRSWWSASMDGADVEAYEMQALDRSRLVLGIEADGRRACFYRR